MKKFKILWKKENVNIRSMLYRLWVNKINKTKSMTKKLVLHILTRGIYTPKIWSKSFFALFSCFLGFFKQKQHRFVKFIIYLKKSLHYWHNLDNKKIYNLFQEPVEQPPLSFDSISKLKITKKTNLANFWVPKHLIASQNTQQITHKKLRTVTTKLVGKSW